MPKQRRIIIVAGPNGAGKTTSLPSPEIAIARVAARVAQAGHNVAKAAIRRRFDSGLLKFRTIYVNLVDKWEWYDNSGNTPQLISEEGSWK